MSTRRQFIGAVAAGLAGLAAPARGQAPAGLDGWPARSVRVISPTGTGGPGQNFRLYAEQLKDTFGQSFVLENMPGGSGAIGSMTVARAAPDGHTLLLASNSHIVLAPLVLTNSPVNVKRDYAAIALMFTFPFLLVVNPTLPVRTLRDLVAYAKARPNELNYGSPGVGTGGHLVTELLVKRTGIDAVHIPYQGTTQQLLAAAAGTLQFTFDTVGNARGLVDAGKVIPLAVTGAQRASAAPDVPTLKDLVTYAKARPNELNYGSPGVGTGGHLVTELLVKRTGIDAVHIPYQGTTQQLLAAAAGTLQFTFDTVGNARGLVDAGKVIPLAVTGAQRASAAPGVPTLKELGYDGFDDLFVANGLLAPTGTSPAVIKALNREMVRMNTSGPIREKLLDASYEPGTLSPEAYGAMIDRELKLWGDVVQETGVRVKA